MTTRYSIIDDTHFDITYEGEWKLANGAGSWDVYDDFGKTLYSTVHSVNSSVPASFSFVFEGSSGRVVGTSGNINPRWDCSVDGNPAKVPLGPGNIANNWPLCEWEADEGVHVLNVNVSQPSTDQINVPFLFDYISIVPAKETRSEMSWIPFGDSSITYDSSWTPFQTTGMQSSFQTPSTFTFTFNGTGIQLLAEAPAGVHRGSGIAVYTLDDGQPVSFEVPFQLPTVHRYNQRLFDIPSILAGTHRLTVSYSGNETIAPLVVNAFIVRQQESAPTGPSTTPTSTTQPPLVASTSHSSSMPIAAVAALALGVLVLLAGIGVGWWFFYRPWIRQHRAKADAQESPAATCHSISSSSVYESGTRLQRPTLKLDMSVVVPTLPPPVILPREKDVRREPTSRRPETLAIQEVQHADSGLRIVDGAVTAYVRPPAYANNRPEAAP